MCSRSIRQACGGPAGGACSPRDETTDEWERYCGEVSGWDVKEYLDVLP
jgi:hypothetical protein